MTLAAELLSDMSEIGEAFTYGASTVYGYFVQDSESGGNRYGPIAYFAIAAIAAVKEGDDIMRVSTGTTYNVRVSQPMGNGMVKLWLDEVPGD